MGPARQTLLPTGLSELWLGLISHAWNGSLYYTVMQLELFANGQGNGQNPLCLGIYVITQ